MKHRVLVWAARVALAAVFVDAGVVKARDPGAFIRDLWNFRLLPESVAYWTAAFVPYLEIAVGLALLSGLQRRGAHLLAGGLLAVFFCFHASAWARGLNIACGCFGPAPAGSAPLHPGWWMALILAMMAALVVSIQAERRQ